MQLVGFDSGKFELHTGLECLNINLNAVLDRLAPLKTVRTRKGHDPWMDDELIGLRRKCDALLRRYLRTKIDRHRNEYAHLRDKFNVRNEQVRDAFMQSKISQALDTNSNGIWGELRNLGLLPQQREELHGIELNTLNSHFASVSTTNARVIDECLDVISKASDDGFRFSPVDFNDVVLAVAHFSTQARGSDGFSQSVIARALPFLGHNIAQIINASLTTGVFLNLGRILYWLL